MNPTLILLFALITPAFAAPPPGTLFEVIKTAGLETELAKLSKNDPTNERLRYDETADHLKRVQELSLYAEKLEEAFKQESRYPEIIQNIVKSEPTLKASKVSVLYSYFRLIELQLIELSTMSKSKQQGVVSINGSQLLSKIMPTIQTPIDGIKLNNMLLNVLYEVESKTAPEANDLILTLYREVTLNRSFLKVSPGKLSPETMDVFIDHLDQFFEKSEN